MAYHVYQDEQNFWRWRLRTANNMVIADPGEGYARKADRLAAIDLVKGAAAAAVFGG